MSSEKKSGRPPNIYGLSSTKFTGWFQYASQKSKERVIDPESALVAYVAKLVSPESGTFTHSFRVTLTPQARGSQFFWVRLETPDQSIDFTIPAPMRLTDIDNELFPRWDVDEPWWVRDTALPSVTMPGVIPRALITSKRSYFVLVREHELSPNVRLMHLRGAHTVPRGLFCGIVTSPEELHFISTFFEPRKGADGQLQVTPSFPNVGEPVTPAQLTRLRYVGAAWAKHHFYDHRKKDESGEPGIWPFVPHADLLEVPFIARTELDL